MNNYLRPIDSRFSIGGVAMPRPHWFKTVREPLWKDTNRDINTGDLILKKVGNAIETTWKWTELRDDQMLIVYNAVQTSTSKFSVTTIDSRKSSGSNLVSLTYDSYEPNDFEPDYFSSKMIDGHRYYQNVELHLTSVKGSIT